MKHINEILPIKKGNGEDEPEMCHLTRQLWAKVNYENPLKRITYKSFIENIKQHIDESDFEWTCKHSNGRRCYPKYDSQVKNWPIYYDYKESVRTYRDYMNGDSEEDLLGMYNTLKISDVPHLLQQAQDCMDRIDEYTRQEKANPLFNGAYLKKAEQERLLMIKEEIRELLNLNKDQLEVISQNTNTNVDLTYEEMIAQEESFFKALYEDKP